MRKFARTVFLITATLWIAGFQPQTVFAGTIVAWGDDTYNEVSNAPTGSNFTTIARGGRHNLALTTQGSIVAWGADTLGQVSDAPVGAGFTAISAGLEHSMALAEDGSIVSWGWDGQFPSGGQVSDTP